MANNVKLDVNTLRVRRERDDTYLPMNNINDGQDFLIWFEDYASSLQKLERDEVQKRCLSIVKNKLNTYRPRIPERSCHTHEV